MNDDELTFHAGAQLTADKQRAEKAAEMACDRLDAIKREIDALRAENAALQQERDELVEALNGFVEPWHCGGLNWEAALDNYELFNKARALLNRIKETK